MDRSRSLIVSVLAGIVLCIAAVIVIDRLQQSSSVTHAAPSAAVPLVVAPSPAPLPPVLGWALVVFIGVVATRLTHQLLDRPRRTAAAEPRETHLTTAVAHARSETPDRRAADIAARSLAEMTGRLAASLDVDQAADGVVTAATRLLRARRAVLWALDDTRAALVGVAAAGEGDPARWLGRPVPLAGTLAGRAVTERRPAASDDLLSDVGPALPAWARELLQHEGNAAGLAIPVAAGAHVVGALAVIAPAGRVFGEDEQQLLAAFADQATLALQIASVLAVSETRRLAAEAMLDAARTLGSGLPLDRALAQVAERAARAAGADRCVLHVRRGDRLAQATAWPHEAIDATGAASDRAPALAEALRGRDYLVLDDAPRAGSAQAPCLVVPLLHREETIGTLTLERRAGADSWTREHIDLARAIAYQLASAIGAVRPAPAVA